MSFLTSNLNYRFVDAIEYLYNVNQYLAAEVTRLGYPTISSQIPTAAVVWDPKKKRINFQFNKDFADKLTDEEFAWVVCHEAVHVINAHILTLLEKVDILKAKKDPKIHSFLKKFAIASDCIVNDSMTNVYGFKKIFDPKSNDQSQLTEQEKKDLERVFGKVKFKDQQGVDVERYPGALYGKNVVGFDCHDYDVMSLINMLKDNEQQQSQKGQKGQGAGSGKSSIGQDGTADISDMSAADTLDDHGWDTFFDENGNISKDFLDQMKDLYNKNDGNASLSDKEQDAIDKLGDKLAKTPGGLQAGNGLSNGKVSVAKDPRSMKWDRILIHTVETKKVEDKWNRQPRKLMGVYPDVILPKTEDRENFDVTVAIDVSGSIDFEMLKLFLNLCRNAPSNVKINAFLFDTSCYPFDIKKDEKVNAGGGTNFGIIEDYIIKNFKRYPKAVVVMTDGHGSPVHPKYPDRWIWMLYGSFSNHYCKDMKHFELSKFI